jgi:hypothetical protein
MTTNCLHGIDPRFCAGCLSKPPVAVRSQRRRSPRLYSKGRMSSSFLDYEFTSADRVLMMRCNIEGGWRFHTRTACFVERTVVDSLEDRRIVVDVRLFPRPGLSSHDWIPRLSDFWASASTAPMKAISVDDQDNGLTLLLLRIDLVGEDDGFNPAFQWRRAPSGRIFSFWGERLIAADWCRRNGSPDQSAIQPPDSHIDMQVWIWPEPRPFIHPISMEWSRRFFPGGLPCLGKTRP